MRQVPIKRADTNRLHAHATRVIEESEAFKVAPHERVLQTLKRRRRRSERLCYSLRCQAKLGLKRLDVKRSLAIQVTKNLAHQCDVIGKVYDLEKKEVDLTSRARAGCSMVELVRSINDVLCHIASQQRKADRERASGPPPTAEPKRDCLAHAELVWVDGKVEEIMTRKRRRRRGRKQPWEQRMAERLLDLRREYDKVARFRVPRWTAAATCCTGRLYETFADQELARSEPVPYSVRREGAEAVAAYEKSRKQARKQRAEPFRQKAADLYRKCLGQVKKLELPPSRYFKEARERLDQIEAGAEKTGAEKSDSDSDAVKDKD
jgi:hypothetical protein